jgi:hypothetical protein
LKSGYESHPAVSETYAEVGGKLYVAPERAKEEKVNAEDV